MTQDTWKREEDSLGETWLLSPIQGGRKGKDRI
jgi:hypothetical protein